jgi:hypothetical protein
MSELMAAYHIMQSILLVLLGGWIILFVWTETRK